MVSWVLIPIALLAGVIFGIILILLVSTGEDDDQ
jgi:uncharacterized membrane-anchored protein YhcB (DUF1043 family)